HARPAERGAEEERGGERRLPRDAAAVACAIDDERRQRRRLVQEERRLPTRAGAARVEPRLVADDAARDALDSGGAHLARQRREPRRGERRIAVALEDEVALPRAGDRRTRAEHVGLEPEGRAERGEGGEGDRQLLV